MRTKEEIEKMIDDLKQMKMMGDWDRGYVRGRISSLEWFLEDAARDEKEINEMNVIEFAKDYKKLHCKVGDIFTTIRRDNDENAERFEDHEGEIFQVRVEGKDAFQAKLMLNSGPDGVRLPYLPDAILEYDTDGDVENLKARYGRGKVVLLIFQKIGGSA